MTLTLVSHPFFSVTRLRRLPQISDALSFVKEILHQLTSQRGSIEEDIQSSFEDLHKQLDVRKSVLLMELEVTYGLKQKVENKMRNISCFFPSS